MITLRIIQFMIIYLMQHRKNDLCDKVNISGVIYTINLIIFNGNNNKKYSK